MINLCGLRESMSLVQKKDLNEYFPGCELIKEEADYFILGKPVAIPWIILVPKNSAIENMELTMFKAAIDLKDLLQKTYPSFIHNIAKIGNKNPNYHVHLLFRNEHDALWPIPVWCKEDELENSDIQVNKINEVLNAN